MDSFKDVLEAAQMYCKAQMAEPTYNLYIDGLELSALRTPAYHPVGAQRFYLQDRHRPVPRPAQGGLQVRAGL